MLVRNIHENGLLMAFSHTNVVWFDHIYPHYPFLSLSCSWPLPLPRLPPSFFLASFFPAPLWLHEFHKDCLEVGARLSEGNTSLQAFIHFKRASWDGLSLGAACGSFLSTCWKRGPSCSWGGRPKLCFPDFSVAFCTLGLVFILLL